MTAIILSFIYLLYLSLICQTLLIHDSLGYMSLGKDIFEKGMAAYIQHGPQREPLYPLLVASALRLAQTFSLDALWVLKLFHIILLVTAQIFAFLLLGMLRIEKPYKDAAVLYIGCSPVLVNSVMWVYSEIAVIPLVLMIVWCAAKCWENINSGWHVQAIRGACLGLSLAGAVFVKDAFELIALFIMAPFTLLGRRAAVALLCCAAAFYIPVTAYKCANKALNGHFTFTNRVTWALYGNTARRAEPLTPRRLTAALAYMPSPHACYALLDRNDCDFWSYKPSDEYGYNKLAELKSNGVPPAKIDGELLRLSTHKALERPWQYAFLAFLESLKMFFWETVKAGQVFYPAWLEYIYNLPGLEALLIAAASILSACGFVYLIRFCLRKPQGPAFAPALFILIMATAYAFCHSFFFVLQRYALPVAPLWIIGIAFWLNALRRKSR